MTKIIARHPSVETQLTTEVAVERAFCVCTLSMYFWFVTSVHGARGDSVGAYIGWRVVTLPCASTPHSFTLHKNSENTANVDAPRNNLPFASTAMLRKKTMMQIWAKTGEIITGLDYWKKCYIEWNLLSFVTYMYLDIQYNKHKILFQELECTKPKFDPLKL